MIVKMIASNQIREEVEKRNTFYIGILGKIKKDIFLWYIKNLANCSSEVKLLI